MNYQMRAHAVTVEHIEAVLPLIIGGDKLVAPDQGIILRLDSGKKLKWLAEPNVPMPQVNDCFVQDAELGTTFVVSASKFDALFQVA